MRDEGGDVEPSESGTELLGPRPTVDKYQPLFAAMQAGDHECGVVEASDVVKGDGRDLDVRGREGSGRALAVDRSW